MHSGSCRTPLAPSLVSILCVRGVPTEILQKTTGRFRDRPDDGFMSSEKSLNNELAHSKNSRTTCPINVLIVDDDLSARTRIRDLLVASNVDVVIREAANGLAAIDRIKDDRPDLLLLDIEMPELDGVGVLRLLRGWPEVSRPPFIAVVSTCISDPTLADGIRLLGANAVSSKPISRDAAEHILNSLIEKPLFAA